MVKAACLVLILAMLAGMTALPFVAQPGFAQTRITVPTPNWCAFEGQSVWRDRDARINALARLTIDLRCIQGEVVALRVLAETRCARTLCTWNFAERAEPDGEALRAVFFTFSATRVMTLQLTGQTVSATVVNDYNQAGRATDEMRARLVLERATPP